jgi:hypothetical protein
MTKWEHKINETSKKLLKILAIVSNVTLTRFRMPLFWRISWVASQPNYKLRNCQVICKTPSLVRDCLSTSWRIFSSATKMRSLVGGQDRAYSFRNTRNREDAAQRLQRFVHWEVSFEETFHRSFVLLALNVHGFAIDQNYIDFLQVGESHLWFKLRLRLRFLSKWINFELNNKKVYYDFFIKFSVSQTFFEKLLVPFSRKISTFV